jgi:hypothetical protein
LNSAAGATAKLASSRVARVPHSESEASQPTQQLEQSAGATEATSTSEGENAAGAVEAEAENGVKQPAAAQDLECFEFPSGDVAVSTFGHDDSRSVASAFLGACTAAASSVSTPPSDIRSTPGRNDENNKSAAESEGGLQHQQYCYVTAMQADSTQKLVCSCSVCRPASSQFSQHSGGLEREASFGALAAEADTMEEKLKLVESKRKWVMVFAGLGLPCSLLTSCTYCSAVQHDAWSSRWIGYNLTFMLSSVTSHIAAGASSCLSCPALYFLHCTGVF